MIEVRNTTRAAIGILRGILIPAQGHRRISAAEYKAALATMPFQGRLNAGDLIATDLTAHERATAPAEWPSEARDGGAAEGNAPETVPAASEAHSAPPGRDDLIAEAQVFGIKVRRNMKTETIARKIAERKARARG